MKIFTPNNLLPILCLFTCLVCPFNKATAQLVTASTVQQGIMPLYVGPVQNLNHLRPDELERLGKSGINRLIVSGYTLQDFTTIVNIFNTNAILNKFKVILSVGGPLYDGYFGCLYNPPCNAPNNLSPSVQSLLQSVVLLSKQNPVVGGYYTFDEPSLQIDTVHWVQGINKVYQKNAYDFIRGLDSDIVNRPVCVANTMYDKYNPVLPDSIIDYSMSNDVQDIVFIDQYDNNVTTETAWFQKWKDHGLLTKPCVVILPAFRSDNTCAATTVSSYASAIQQAITSVFQTTPPQIAGLGLFAYWPVSKTDFQYALDNCPAIMEDVCNYLSSLPSGLLAEWRLDQNVADNGPLNSSATTIGSPVFSDQYYVEGNGSLFFDGNSQGLQVSSYGGILKDGFETRTLMFWVQPFAATSTQMLYEEGDYGNGLALRINQGSLQVALANFGTDYLYTIPNFTFQNSVWYHIAVTFDHGSLNVYIDGSLVYFVTSTTVVGAHWDPAGLGMTITNGGIGNAFGATDNTSSFYGFFDDLRIYTNVVSPQSISYTSQALFGQWRWNNSTLNEGSGDSPASLQGATYSSDAMEGENSLSCDGSPQGAELSNSSGFLRAEIKKRTIAFWMKPAVLNIDQMLYAEGDGGNGIAIRINHLNKLEAGIACFGSLTVYTINSVTISSNTWYLVVLTFNAGVVDMYINNQKVEGTFNYTAINPHWAPAAVGMVINGGLGDPFGLLDATGGFTGVIDNVRVYNSVLPEPYLRDLCQGCGAVTLVNNTLTNNMQDIHPSVFDDKASRIYASLSNGMLIISSSLKIRSYTLLDVSGKKLSGKDNVNTPHIFDSTPVLTQGIYIIKVIQSDGHVHSIKVFAASR